MSMPGADSARIFWRQKINPAGKNWFPISMEQAVQKIEGGVGKFGSRIV
jgi:hypothetical protein